MDATALEAIRAAERRGTVGGDAKSKFLIHLTKYNSKNVGSPMIERPRFEFQPLDDPAGMKPRQWRAIFDGRHFLRQKKADAELCWYEYFINPDRFFGSNEPAPWPEATVAASEQIVQQVLPLMPPTVESTRLEHSTPLGSALARIGALEASQNANCTKLYEQAREIGHLRAEVDILRDNCESLHERINSMQRRMVGLLSDVDVHGGWLHVMRDDFVRFHGPDHRTARLPYALPCDRHNSEPLLGYMSEAEELTRDGDVESNPGPVPLWALVESIATSIFWLASTEALMVCGDDIWIRDLTEEGVEPNPGWAHGRFKDKGKSKAPDTPPTSRSRESSPPNSPKDSLYPMRKKKAVAKQEPRKTTTRSAKKGQFIKTSVAASVQQLRGEMDAQRAMYRAGIPCRDYMRGECQYGLACAYNHDVSDNSSSSTAPAGPKERCRRFSRPGGCPFGAQCRYLHPAVTASAPSAAPNRPPIPTVANATVSGPTSLGSLNLAQKPKQKFATIVMQAGGALSGTSASSTPSSGTPLPAPTPATAAIIQVNPTPPELSDEMKARLKQERWIRRRLNRRTKLVFYERVGISNPLTALILAAASLLLIAASAILETALAYFEVAHWSLSLLATIPLVITCMALFMVVLVYLTAGQKLIRHQYILIKDPSRWLPDQDLRTDLGATSRLDHDTQRLARFEYTRSFCFTHNEKSNRKKFLRYRCALAWENIVRSVCFLPRLEIVTKKGEYSEELLAQCCNAHNMSVRTDLETVKDRVSQVVRTKASMPLNKFDQTSANYITGNTEALGVAVWMDQQRSLRHLPFVVAPSPTATFSL